VAEERVFALPRVFRVFQKRVGFKVCRANRRGGEGGGVISSNWGVVKKDSYNVLGGVNPKKLTIVTWKESQRTFLGGEDRCCL